jgi:RHS repeat-associated protein
MTGASNEAVVANYSYDYMSRRYRKIVSGVTNTFVYDGWNLIQETSSAGVTNTYVWGLDLSGTQQGAGGIGGMLSVTRNGSTYFPCYDANGNITDYVDASGAVVAHREYDAYGNTVASSGQMVNDFNFWFSSKYLDQETGLLYYGYRYYVPEIGRWVGRDPIENTGFTFIPRFYRYRSMLGLRVSSGTPNLFSFVNNEPILWFDFMGAIPIKADSSTTAGGSDKKSDPWEGVPPGSIICNKKCKMEITGCDKWPKVLQSCCQKHETVHLGQVGPKFCQGTEKCCPDAGKPPHFGTPEMKDMKAWPNGECPAYTASIECMDALLGTDLSVEDRKIVLGKLGQECGIMKSKKCPDIPSACDSF